MAVNLMNQSYFLRLEDQKGEPLAWEAAMGFAKIMDCFIYDPPEVLNKHDLQKDALRSAINKTINAAAADPQAQVVLDNLIKAAFKKHYGQSLN